MVDKRSFWTTLGRGTHECSEAGSPRLFSPYATWSGPRRTQAHKCLSYLEKIGFVFL